LGMTWLWMATAPISNGMVHWPIRAAAGSARGVAGVLGAREVLCPCGVLGPWAELHPTESSVSTGRMGSHRRHPARAGPRAAERAKRCSLPTIRHIWHDPRYGHKPR